MGYFTLSSIPQLLFLQTTAEEYVIHNYIELYMNIFSACLES